MQKVEREIVVLAPADTVYQIWRNFENFPQLMSNIEDVRDIGDGRSHWKAKGALGRDAEWDAMITEDEPGRVVAWRSLDSEDTNVRTEGAVRFESMGDQTRVHVELAYDAGGVKEFIAKWFADPEREVEEDLARFKDRVESGGEYARATERIVGTNVPESEEAAVKARYPANAYEPAEEPFTDSVDEARKTGLNAYPAGTAPAPDMASATGIATGTTDDPVSKVQGKYPANVDHDTRAPDGEPGHPEPGTMRPSTATIPGGTLSGPTKRDPSPDDRGILPPKTKTQVPDTTASPGGTLGTPTEGELKSDPEEKSDRQDPRA